MYKDKDCLTGKECEASPYYAKAFAPLGKFTKAGVVDADFDVNENVYTCKDSKYVLFTEDGGTTTASCVSFGECTEDKIVLEAGKLCLEEAECTDMKYFVKVAGSNVRYCVPVCPEQTPAHDDDRVCTTCEQIMADSYSWNTKWDAGAEKCTDRCDFGDYLSISGTQCLSSCPENQTSDGNKCVCAANAALVSAKDRCVVVGSDPAC